MKRYRLIESNAQNGSLAQDMVTPIKWQPIEKMLGRDVPPELKARIIRKYGGKIKLTNTIHMVSNLLLVIAGGAAIAEYFVQTVGGINLGGVALLCALACIILGFIAVSFKFYYNSKIRNAQRNVTEGVMDMMKNALMSVVKLAARATVGIVKVMYRAVASTLRTIYNFLFSKGCDLPNDKKEQVAEGVVAASNLANTVVGAR